MSHVLVKVIDVTLQVDGKKHGPGSEVCLDLDEATALERRKNVELLDLVDAVTPTAGGSTSSVQADDPAAQETLSKKKP